MIKKQLDQLEERVRDLSVQIATSPFDTPEEVAEFKTRTYIELNDISRQMLKLSAECDRCGSVKSSCDP